MIGGIVGGVLGLLLLIGIVAFFVVRNRRANTNAKERKDVEPPSNGDYGRIQISHRTNEYALAPIGTGTTAVSTYDDVSDVRMKRNENE
jgi:hypothetical protein